MNLTSENTAIVLDSTSDYPDAPARFPNMRFVPLYVRFGDETYRDYLELGPAEFYERLRASAVTPATAQPTPPGLRHRLRGALRLRADLLAPRHREALRHVPERRARGAGDRRGQGARRRLDDSLARHRDARARDPAQARPRYDRRGRSPRSSTVSTRTRTSSSPSRRSSSSNAAAGSARRRPSPDRS